MKNQSFLFALFLITSAYAGPVERKTVQDKTEALSTLKTRILTTKVKAEVNARDLKVQRDLLQQKIRAHRQEFKTDSTTLKDAAKRSIDELNAAVKKLKETPKLSDDERDANIAIAQATTEETALTQTAASLETIELPREILD